MIGIVDVEVQAANPQMPLCPFVAFVGSPSSVRVRNVPSNIGSWNITKVYVSANYPDNSIQSRECTRVGEIYVGTLPACNAVGKGANGFVVSADGVDENGNAVTGYVLGKGDLEILTADGAIVPGVTTHYVHGHDAQPANPREYDIYKDGDTWKIYFDGAWGALGPTPTTDDTVTKNSANAVKSSGIWSAIWGALTALPTGFTSLYDWCVDQLADKASKSDATLTARYTDWVCDPAMTPGEIEYFVIWYTIPDTDVESWCLVTGLPDIVDYVDHVDPATPGMPDITSATFTGLLGETVTATRTALQGYRLGPDDPSNLNRDKPLASEAEAEALRNGKANNADVVHKTGAETIDGSKTFTSNIISSTGNKLVAYGSSIFISGGAIVDFPANSGTMALIYDIPYDLGTPTAIDTASSETVEGETVYYGVATLANRTANIVQVTAATALDELRITFPAATSGKVRDFGLRVEIGTGSAALAAPALVPIAPTGETIKLENAEGTIPELADGTATAKGVTLLYFSETAPGVFVVKGEQVEEVA